MNEKTEKAMPLLWCHAKHYCMAKMETELKQWKHHHKKQSQQNLGC